MGYSKVNNTLAEQGVAVDMLGDESLFVLVRSARSKAVEKSRQKHQAPYRNLILAGRPLPVGVSQQIGRKITAEAVIAGIAGEIGSHRFGKIDEGKPVEWGYPDAEQLIGVLQEFPDFEEDVATASNVNATFAESEPVREDGNGDPAPTTTEAIGEAAGNSPPSSDGGASTANT